MARKIGRLSAIAAVGVLGAASIGAMSSTASAHGRWARATLRSADGTRIGNVEFGGDRHSDSTEVTVHLRRAGALTAFHGLHIHANDDTTNGDGCIADPALASSTWFVSADGHWKKDPSQLHGNHTGDLPSVYVNADGTASIEFNVDKLTPEDVIGRAVVFHAGPDNFGNVPVGTGADQYTANSSGALTKTQGTGNAGDRYACGVIEER